MDGSNQTPDNKASCYRDNIEIGGAGVLVVRRLATSSSGLGLKSMMGLSTVHRCHRTATDPLPHAPEKIIGKHRGRPSRFGAGEATLGLGR